MSKIEVLGNGFIQVDGTLYNLRGYKTVEKYTFGLGEDPEGGSAFSITLTPFTPSKKDYDNGVDGTFHIAEYEDEESVNKDFDAIKSLLKNEH